MKHILLYIILLSSPGFLFAQRNQGTNQTDHTGLQTVKSFISQLADQSKPLDVILSQKVLVQNPTEEWYDYLEVSLQEIRINLSSKDLDKIEYKSYHQLPKNEVRDIDPEDLSVDQMYFLYYKNRLITSIYVIGNKIGSFTLVSKGNNLAHFVTY